VKDELVGRGEQEIACMRRHGEQLLPTSIPVQLREVLAEFAEAQAS